ncbi:MAG: Peptidase M48 Ste24p [Candidatus Gallionella acididurans]|uniref:Peptidase M48 Ste24p n=1 Tax=Candidatus Gallionella acididurans TaxID=1796491 RepID=A0A139BXE4_9PROT|nr:MAG: Peptidase M48 Ste24p [Candidatus Gallionella acididurans]
MKKTALLLLLCFPAYVLGDGLPDLGDVSQAALTPLQEREIGQQSMMQIRASKQFLDDSEVNDYLNQIGYRLVENSPEPGLEFEFFAVNDYGINAFAMPGGFIGVNAGLLLITQSESELASVLSHEISHVTQHHLARMIASQQGDSLISMATIALAILAARTNPQASEAAIISAQARSMQKQLNFTRSYEEEADRIGLQLLRKSGFNTHAMPEFLERMQNSTRLLEGNAPNYMRTHPITSDRIAEIENRVQKDPYRLIPDSLNFQLVRTKLIGAQKTAPAAIAFFSEALGPQGYGNPVAQRYGLVSALLRDNQIDRAAQELAILRKQAQDNPMYRNNPMIATLTGRVMRAQKNNAATLAFYRNAVLNFPQHRALTYDYADLLLQDNQAETALKLLSEQVGLHPTDTRLYDLQARAYAMQGKALEEHQALAYSYAWQGNLYAAMEQLEMAKQAGGSFYQLSSIESDLRELRELRDAQGKK